LSMGGYGAMLNAFRYPDLFSRVIALDSAFNKIPIVESVNEKTWDLFLKRNYESMFNTTDISTYKNSFNDYEYLAEKLTKTAPEKMPKIFMAAGRGDQLYPANTAFRDYLLELGYDVTWTDYEGRHSWYSFNQGIDAGIKWLPLDPFTDNMIYYGPDAHIDETNFAHWTTMYNVEMKEQ
ncbi:MAG: alpha/beta hydrolase-fold protein, partial [Eubacteriales bacterium]|nr:alpha/beta hydrolase-fold protein [Eubacteriales bacterium]